MPTRTAQAAETTTARPENAPKIRALAELSR
jgi:hypothetical protein